MPTETDEKKFDEIHRMIMVAEIEKQDREWKALNKINHERIDWGEVIAIGLSTIVVTIFCAGLWYGLNWVESFFR